MELEGIARTPLGPPFAVPANAVPGCTEERSGASTSALWHVPISAFTWLSATVTASAQLKVTNWFNLGDASVPAVYDAPQFPRVVDPRWNIAV